MSLNGGGSTSEGITSGSEGPAQHSGTVLVCVELAVARSPGLLQALAKILMFHLPSSSLLALLLETHDKN